MYRFAFLLIFFLTWGDVVNAQYTEKTTSESISDSLGNFYLQEALNVYHKNFDSTFIYVYHSLDHFQKSENWEGISKCYGALSSLYSYQGDYVKGDSIIKVNLNLAQQKLDKDSDGYGAALNNYGFYLRRRGNYDQAVLYFREGLRIDLLSNNKLNIAAALTNIGNTYLRKGDFEEGLTFYKEAYQYQLDSLGPSWRSASTSIKIGKVYQTTQNWQEAFKWYLDAEKVLTQKRNKLGQGEVVLKLLSSVLFSMGELFVEKEEWGEAIKKVEAAQKISEQVYVVDQGRADDILGEINFRQKKYLAALDHFKQSKKNVCKEYSAFEKHPLIAEKDIKIALVFVEMEDWNKSLFHYQQALEMVTHDSGFFKVDTKPDSIYAKLIGLEGLMGKAKSHYHLYLQSKNKKELLKAFETYGNALTLIPEIRQDFLTGDSKELLSSKVLPLYEGAIEVCILLYDLTGTPSYLDRAFTFAEGNKSILLLESINEITAKNFAGIPDSLLEKEKELTFLIRDYEQKINNWKQKKTTGYSEKITQLERKLFNANQSYHSLIRVFETQFPKYFNLKYQTSLADVINVQKALPDTSTILIEYFFGNEYIYIFAVQVDEIKVHKLLKTKQLMDDIGGIRRFVNRPPTQKNIQEEYVAYTSIAYDLYQKLIEPVLSQDIKSLIIVPDDILGLVPFEMLLVAKPENSIPDYSLGNLSYLLSEFDISYSFSSTLFLNNNGKEQNVLRKEFTGFAPSFKTNDLAGTTRSCGSGTLYNLQCNQDEVNQIYNLLGGKKYLGERATLSSFFEDAGQSSIIHLATHACLDDNNHQFNKIYFADGHLSNKELYHLFLQSNLAVLSACNTGMGQLVKGEGVMSLSRGFIHAGCPSIVMSFWAVDDCTTSDIMVNFYSELKNYQSKSIALKNAKLTFLKTAKKAQQHPYFWAAFVQFGDSAPLESFRDIQNYRPYLWTISILFLFFLISGSFRIIRKK